jgi:Tfp pilus assembly protein PilN
MSLATSSGKTLTVAGTFPHVNLLPPEIAAEAKFRRTRMLLSLVVVGAVAVTGGLYVMASNQAASAADDLASAQATQSQLQAEAAKYADVPKVYAQVAAAQQDLTQAMGQEVRYSYVLNDLSLTLAGVNGVWLTNLAVSQAVDDPSSSKSALGNPSIGTITFTGDATKHTDVAAWLDGLAKTPYYTDPYFSSSVVGQPIGTTPIVTFTSQVSLTEKALSNRYNPKAGG